MNNLIKYSVKTYFIIAILMGIRMLYNNRVRHCRYVKSLVFFILILGLKEIFFASSLGMVSLAGAWHFITC